MTPDPCGSLPTPTKTPGAPSPQSISSEWVPTLTAATNPPFDSSAAGMGPAIFTRAPWRRDSSA